MQVDLNQSRHDVVKPIDPQGWLQSARRVDSPNFDDRPAGDEPEVLVIHSISLPPGRFSGPGVEQLFTNRLNPEDDPYYRLVDGLKVSCHFFIRRTGELVQFVPTCKRAWHCGLSFCLGRQSVNNFSIGVELEGLDNAPFERVQYQNLVNLTKSIQARYPAIVNQHIFGHQHIAPGRKSDPGCGFDWYYYLSTL